MSENNTVYIANDVESAGSRLGYHSTLSFGACVVTREPLSFGEYWEKGLVFYAELRPSHLTHELEALRIGCSELICLEKDKENDKKSKKESQYDPQSTIFDPIAVLNLMCGVCQPPELARSDYLGWLETKREGKKVVGLTDTVFFDGGRVDMLLGSYWPGPSPYGHKGLDLDSLYRGHTGRANAKLKELGVKDERTKPHRADHDAVFLAQMARVLLFEKMGW